MGKEAVKFRSVMVENPEANPSDPNSWVAFDFEDLGVNDVFYFADDSTKTCYRVTSPPEPCEPEGNWKLTADPLEPATSDGYDDARFRDASQD